MEEKSLSAVLYPKVDEFAILSEIVASLLAFTFKPVTPAFMEEEMLTMCPFDLSEWTIHATPLRIS